MAVTDLTGTKWEFAEDFFSNDYMNEGFNLNFTSNGESYQSLFLMRTATAPDDRNPTYIMINISIDYDGTNAFSYFSDGSYTTSEWTNEAYRTISITGGTDVTNSNLISWLQSNATQIQDESNTFSFGNLPIANMFFGTRQVKKVYLGNALVWEKEATLITFTINSVSYQAEEGMTWGEWVASQYNTGGYYASGNLCFSSSGNIVYYNPQTMVDVDSEIVADYPYFFVIAPVGGGGTED